MTASIACGSVTRQMRLCVPSSSSNSPNGSCCLVVGSSARHALRSGSEYSEKIGDRFALRRLLEAEAVGLRAGVRALVRADRAGAVVLHAHACEEAVARQAPAVGAGVLLDERPDRLVAVLDHRTLVLPCVEQLGGVGVAVAAVGVLGQVDVDDVVRRARGQLCALLGVDDVVGRGGELLQRPGDRRGRSTGLGGARRAPSAREPSGLSRRGAVRWCVDAACGSAGDLRPEVRRVGRGRPAALDVPARRWRRRCRRGGSGG